MIKRSDHQVFQFCICRSCRGCGLGELAGLLVFFLREQMSNLPVQEFLRELIVGVATPSELAGSILVKILHYGKGENIEQVVRTSKQISRVYDCSSLSTHLCLYLACLLYLYSSITCLILLVLHRYTY